ncbi:MAG: mercury resistance system transport protein MerF [Alphaproteobacteria bacterium]|nr:mercury resistance system transport protein MerF [Alphaproteobacteria bacterium]
MTPKRQLTLWTAAAGVTGLCCFTPLLVVALGAVGLSAWLVWLDLVLLPALILFLTLAVLAYFRLQRGRQMDGS